ANQIVSKRNGDRPRFKIRNVNSHSLGVVGTDRATGRRRNGILIPRNTPIPVTAKRVFRTKRAGQKSILVQVVEGESRTAEECTQIGQCSVRQLPPNLPAGTPVDVQFSYQPDGRLRVLVSVPNTSSQLETEFARANTLSQELLDGWRRHISGLEPPVA
ncbi:MAG: Hsp70 family protein, partial [Pirellulales bacterium]|nr:Hsp70 family protein [Pirellulales bacterium]